MPLLLPESIPLFKSALDAPLFANPDPDRLALVEVRPGEDDLKYSRAEVIAQCQKAAKGLLSRGVARDDIIVIALERPSQICFCYWGALLLGARPVVYPTRTPKMDPRVYEENLYFLHQQLDIRGLICEEKLLASPAGEKQFLRLSFEELAHCEPASGELPGIEVSPEDIAHLQTSSGTTGRQKVVPLTHQAIINQVAIYSRALAAEPDEIPITWMPLYHDGGLIFGVLLPFLQGYPAVLMSPVDWVTHPIILFRAITKYKATMVLMPNFGYGHCARRIRDQELEGISLDSVRLFITGAERVYHDTLRRFADRFESLGVDWQRISITYGLAEAGLAVTQTPAGTPIYYDTIDEQVLMGEGVARPPTASTTSTLVIPSCGAPVFSAEVSIWDSERKKQLPERRVGEVGLRSASLFSGYYQRPDLTEKSFHNGWYMTGDLGYLSDGELFITGRKSDLIISGGKNIYPTDIEEIVFAVEGVRPGRAAAFGVFDPREGTELIAVVAESYSKDVEEQADLALRIRKAIAEKSPVVASYVYVTGERWIIKTSSGKTARSANREKWMAENLR